MNSARVVLVVAAFLVSVGLLFFFIGFSLTVGADDDPDKPVDEVLADVTGAFLITLWSMVAILTAITTILVGIYVKCKDCKCTCKDKD